MTNKISFLFSGILILFLSISFILNTSSVLAVDVNALKNEISGPINIDFGSKAINVSKDKNSHETNTYTHTENSHNKTIIKNINYYGASAPQNPGSNTLPAESTPDFSAIKPKPDMSAYNLGKQYVRGFRLYQYNVELNSSVADNPLPAVEIGSFRAKKSIFSTKELAEIIGIPVNSAKMYRAVGFLKVDQPDTYTINVTSEGYKSYGCIFVDNKLCAHGKNEPFSLSGTVTIEKHGIYLVDIRVYDGINDELIAYTKYHTSKRNKLNFMIKCSNDEMLKPLHTVLFTKK